MNNLRNISDNQLLQELEKRIKAGQIKIDWDEDEYGEEYEIKGLYTKEFNLSLFWYDEANDNSICLYTLFPSRREREKGKMSSWRNVWLRELTDQDKAFFEREMEQVKISKYCGLCPKHCKNKSHEK